MADNDKRIETGIIVGFEPQVTAQDYHEAVSALGLTLARLQELGSEVLDGFVMKSPTRKAVASLALISLDRSKLSFDRLKQAVEHKDKSVEGVTFVERNVAVAPLAPPPLMPDPKVGEQWALKTLRVDRPWNRPPPGGKTIVAIVDTGLRRPDGSLPEDFSNVEPLAECQPPADLILHFPALYPDGVDQAGHGTLLGGTIAPTNDNGKGVASAIPNDWGISLMPIKFFGPQRPPTTFDAFRAMIWAVGKGAKVINASWHVALGDEVQYSLQTVIDWAISHNCLVVAAAGNDGTDNMEYPTYPANYDQVLTVAATARDDFKATFSNYNSKWVDIAAPGLHIVTTGAYWSGQARYPYYSGTSAAAAFASAGAALVYALNPKWTALEVAQYLKDSADKLPQLRRVCVDGNRLNLARAVYGPLHMTAPAAGDTLTAGAPMTISWSNDFPAQKLAKVKIDFSPDGGKNWNTPAIADSANNSSVNGSLTWTPQGTDKTSNGVIRIAGVDGSTDGCFPVPCPVKVV